MKSTPIAIALHCFFYGSLPRCEGSPIDFMDYTDLFRVLYALRGGRNEDSPKNEEHKFHGFHGLRREKDEDSLKEEERGGRGLTRVKWGWNSLPPNLCPL